jgi:hypothetical protein
MVETPPVVARYNEGQSQSQGGGGPMSQEGK